MEEGDGIRMREVSEMWRGGRDGWDMGGDCDAVVVGEKE